MTIYMMQLIRYHEQSFDVIDAVKVSNRKTTTRQLLNNTTVSCKTSTAFHSASCSLQAAAYSAAAPL